MIEKIDSRLKMKDIKRFSISLPINIYEWVFNSSKNNSRSMAGEILEILKEVRKAKEKEEAQKSL